MVGREYASPGGGGSVRGAGRWVGKQSGRGRGVVPSWAGRDVPGLRGSDEAFFFRGSDAVVTPDPSWERQESLCIRESTQSSSPRRRPGPSFWGTSARAR